MSSGSPADGCESEFRPVVGTQGILASDFRIDSRTKATTTSLHTTIFAQNACDCAHDERQIDVFVGKRVTPMYLTKLERSGLLL